MTPLDDVAGTTQPGTRHVPDPAPSVPTPAGPRRVAPPAGEPGPLSPPWGPGGKKSPQRSRERAVAGTASPVPGKTRSVAESSAAVTGDRAEAAQAPAGRTYTLALPPGLALLSLNDRGHWAARYRRSEALKKAAWALALSQRIPRLDRVSVLVEYQPPDLRRRDPDNVAAAAKVAIDALRLAGVLAEDDSRHVTEVTCRIGSLYPKGRLVLTLTEVPAVAGGAA